jgi:hypothetical protein
MIGNWQFDTVQKCSRFVNPLKQRSMHIIHAVNWTHVISCTVMLSVKLPIYFGPPRFASKTVVHHIKLHICLPTRLDSTHLEFIDMYWTIAQLNWFASSGASSRQSWPSWVKRPTTMNMKNIYLKNDNYLRSMMKLRNNVPDYVRCENTCILRHQQLEDDTDIIWTVLTLSIGRDKIFDSRLRAFAII